MIWNPGELPTDWTAATLRNKHSSHPYNPHEASVFFRSGQIEAWGRGIELIVNACQSAGTPVPELRYEKTGLWVEFPFAEGAARFSPAETQLELGEERGPHLTPQVTGEVTAQVTAALRMLGVIQGSMSRGSMQRAVGLSHVENFRLQYLLTRTAFRLHRNDHPK